jgi:hypothetical protein
MISFINDTEYVPLTKKVIVKMVDLPPGDWDLFRNIGILSHEVEKRTETMEKNMDKNTTKKADL